MTNPDTSTYSRTRISRILLHGVAGTSRCSRQIAVKPQPTRRESRRWTTGGSNRNQPNGIITCYQALPNFHEILSTTNDYNQTFAHLSILYDYPSLLARLIDWHIDLTITDVNGLTALHCA